MKITIVSSGSRGDIQPYIALGIGLQKSGHDVTIATHGNFKDFVEENGLKILEMVGNPKEILDSEQGKTMLESGSNPFKSMPMLIDLFKTHLGKFFDGLIEKLEGTEAIIFTTTTFQSYYIAKKLGIPSIAAYLLPFSNTSDFPNIFVPNPHKLGFIYNKMTHLMMEQLLWQPFRKITNEWLTKELKLEPIPFLGNLGGRNTDLFPIVYGFSPSVIPKPKDWNDSVHITGYWFLDKAEEYIPEPKLKDFIESDKAPIYIGFGSMTNRHPEQVASMVIEALNKTGQRGILLSGWGGMSNDDLPDNILMVDSVP
ncbi:MAG: glycosyltransferase family 1 protein, partial [Candidatus Sericytochromatia bacterium]|nr:glycosyltransferase family 1 protein [Candidatus Sericytochromatia bacterium]